MDPIIKKQRIAALILKEKMDELSKSEKEELTSWLQVSPKNEKIYVRLQEKSFSEDIARYQQISTARGLDNYRRRYNMQKNSRLLGKWYWAAAVVAFVIGISTLFFYQEAPPTVAQATISPGSSKAMLILNNGEIISLSEKNKTEIVATEELSIRNEGSQLRYTVSENTKNEQANNYNELIVPKGGEFTLTLSDGTKVWLNSQSKIKYPVIFNDITREVYLEGEAYFEVTKNKKLPFSVLSGKVKIKVLGTKFNFKSYKEDESARVTLVEGSLNVGNIENNVRNVLLIPNQQAVINKKENRVTVKNVDAKSYAMWTHPKQEILDVIPSNVTGQPTASIRVPSVTIRNTLFFNEEPLSQIVRDLERAFNVKIEIKDRQLSTERFYGDFRNDETITEILDIMAANNNLYYTIDGDEIIISRK